VGGEYCPFIVSLYDAYKVSGSLRLVMEFMNGGSLQDLVDHGGSDDEELLAKIAYNVLRVSRQGAQAAALYHDRHINESLKNSLRNPSIFSLILCVPPLVGV
jgi:serine/threonine protein kinase